MYNDIYIYIYAYIYRYYILPINNNTIGHVSVYHKYISYNAVLYYAIQCYTILHILSNIKYPGYSTYIYILYIMLSI